MSSTLENSNPLSLDYFSPSNLFILLFCIFSNSLLKTSNFSFCASILPPRSLIIFTIIISNYYLGKLPICISLHSSSKFLSYSFIWSMFFCHLVLSKLLFALEFFFSYFHFYIFGRLFMFFNIGEVALCIRHPVQPSNALPSCHPSYMF